MKPSQAESRHFRAAVQGALIGLFAACSIRLADKPLGFLVWITVAVVIGAIISVLYDMLFGNNEAIEHSQSDDNRLSLVVNSLQLGNSEQVSLHVPDVGVVKITLQSHWKDGGLLRVSGLIPDDQVVEIHLRVMDE